MDSDLSASELRQRYHRGGTVSDDQLTSAQLRARHAIPSNSKGNIYWSCNNTYTIIIFCNNSELCVFRFLFWFWWEIIIWTDRCDRCCCRSSCRCGLFCYAKSIIESLALNMLITWIKLAFDYIIIFFLIHMAYNTIDTVWKATVNHISLMRLINL